VLDLGCGDGTTALPEAKLGANVLGVDIAANLVAAATRAPPRRACRTSSSQEGDATNLQGLEDGRFELVVSIFGAMFAPRPFDVAKEMTRVTRPGGRIVMGNWIPNDPTLVAQILKDQLRVPPPPPEGFISPMTWGIESSVLERFGSAGSPRSGSRSRERHYTFNFPRRARRPRRRLPPLLRPDHERLEAGREERARRRAAAGASGRCSPRRIRRRARRRPPSRDLPARDVAR